jgi:hypothetical protein
LHRVFPAGHVGPHELLAAPEDCRRPAQCTVDYSGLEAVATEAVPGWTKHTLPVI